MWLEKGLLNLAAHYHTVCATLCQRPYPSSRICASPQQPHSAKMSPWGWCLGLDVTVSRPCCYLARPLSVIAVLAATSVHDKCRHISGAEAAGRTITTTNFKACA
ncbi:hypothetical protein B0I35DRAFT_428478 [Stachybotrys elegans]|uniref:Uncharacterized protein n=1 Tax=Stachybotrys elegans TaxID=80388 RepID=A0A8K0WTD6_9HYPO|nr:hypothetical protein B0I35DRAFT_428478 [Stachybotrys elegans]